MCSSCGSENIVYVCFRRISLFSNRFFVRNILQEVMIVSAKSDGITSNSTVINESCYSGSGLHTTFQIVERLFRMCSNIERVMLSVLRDELPTILSIYNWEFVGYVFHLGSAALVHRPTFRPK